MCRMNLIQLYSRKLLIVSLHLATLMISNHKSFQLIILWSFATLGESHPKLFRKVGNHIASLDNLDRFDAQAFSNILWACATAGESLPKLFKKLADHIVGLNNLDSFKPQELKDVVWAYATAGEAH